MSGYKGYSMSNNAVNAYKNGEMPLSKWTKKAIIEQVIEYDLDVDVNLLNKISVKTMKDIFLIKTSWHHTSNHYNKTDFYSVDIREIESLTKEDLIKLANRKVEKIENEEKWKCKFLEWSGSRRHPVATEVIEIGIVKGNWFYRTDGTKKKTTANGFEFIEKV